MDNWEIQVLKYLGKKIDKAIDEWLGLFVVIAALALATWWKVGKEFAAWLNDHPASDTLLLDPQVDLLNVLPTLLLSLSS